MGVLLVRGGAEGGSAVKITAGKFENSTILPTNPSKASCRLVQTGPRMCHTRHEAEYSIFVYMGAAGDTGGMSIFSRKNEITIPRLPPKATEPTYELNGCENNFNLKWY